MTNSSTHDQLDEQPCGLDILRDKENIDAKYLVGLNAVACAFGDCNAVLPIDMPGARLDSGICLKKKQPRPYDTYVLNPHITRSEITAEELAELTAVVQQHGKYD